MMQRYKIFMCQVSKTQKKTKIWNRDALYTSVVLYGFLHSISKSVLFTPHLEARYINLVETLN